VGGAPEALEGQEAGYLVPPGNVDALENAVARLLEDAELRLAMSKGARRRAQRFSLERMVEDVERLYLEILQSLA